MRTDKGRVTLTESLWVIRAEPHIIQRLASAIPRTQIQDRTTATLKATNEATKDLDWFLQRYRLTVEHPDEMAARVASYVVTQTQMDALHNAPANVERFKMAKPPRQYQATTVEMLLLRSGLLCADVYGLGNTVTTNQMKRGLYAA